MIRDSASNELFTILLVLGLIIIAAAKLLAPKRFNDFVFANSVMRNLKEQMSR